ncbi:hypothetical protein [Crocinitomix algicola]|uniref:hypothetical protein n=1 Tax=Crocinitomix algicola TaxID=1740263 RepID=UPI0008375AED|nr:hypothetical protein [Crocinitomix algicola]
MNCEKITYYIEKGYLTELNLSEKMQIRLHRFICKGCRNYESDSATLNQILELLDKETNQKPTFTLEEKEEIKKALKAL